MRSTAKVGATISYDETFLRVEVDSQMRSDLIVLLRDLPLGNAEGCISLCHMRNIDSKKVSQPSDL